MTPGIKDIWFRSPATLREIASALGLAEVRYDIENHWEWMIGTLDGYELDVTRTHTLAPEDTDTRVFLLGSANFPPSLKSEIVHRLRAITSEPIHGGRWLYRSGNEFDLEVIEEYRADSPA